MKSDVTAKLRSPLNHWIWEKRLNRQYTPHAGYIGDGRRLRLLLGVQGEGVNHLSRLVTQGIPSGQYISDPLEKFQPRIALSNEGDGAAIHYHKDLAADHPLVRVYRILVENGVEWTSFTGQKTESNELYIKPLLLKETHGLLATEALLRELRCHALLYITDPVILAEQIFSREGLDTPYLTLESKAVFQSAFLKRFLPHDVRAVLRAYKIIHRLPSERQRLIQGKILTIALIQHMFRMLAARYPDLATVVDYAELAADPLKLQFPLVNWLGEKGVEFSRHLIAGATFTPAGRERSKWKSSWPESLVSFEILTSRDVNTAHQQLVDCGLMRDEGNGDSWFGREIVNS